MRWVTFFGVRQGVRADFSLLQFLDLTDKENPFFMYTS